MSQFLRLMNEEDKALALAQVSHRLRSGKSDARIFEVSPDAFDSIPGKPFSYWVSTAVRTAFEVMPALQSDTRIAAIGASTKDDGRFLRLNWEVECGNNDYPAFAKGGHYSPFYADIPLVIRWKCDGLEAKTFVSDYRAARGWSPHWKAELHNPHLYFRPGLTWPRRTNGLSFRVMPSGGIFADKGPAAFVAEDETDTLLSLCCLLNSEAFGLLVAAQLARTELAQSFEVGLIQQTPVPNISIEQTTRLAILARRAWSLKRTLDTTVETSHAFALPAALRARLGSYDVAAIEVELASIQAEIDAIAFDLYGFNEADRSAVQSGRGAANEGDAEANADDDGDEDESAAPVDQTAGLLSWSVGVAFGRFDWRLATGERAAPTEPEPFDPLPAKSPGMLPDGATAFHLYAGILVDDQGHSHDLARLIEEVLDRVDMTVPNEVRRWLQRDFFAFHLQRYSKSRRKAPIYWPLTTTSGSYTLWVYYPSLTSQTLYSAINDFIEPKLKQVGADVTVLRNKAAARTRDDEKQFEALQTFELELIELRDTLLELAPNYKPNHDDGVQICAAPLWPLFRHKPWQKLLKDTWAKLETGNYDWAHLAINYWPERVRERCKTDKSIAIAHGLEDLYVEPEADRKKARKKKTRGDE
jgi:hypothetical protein